jgi:hypothetical protein
VRLDDHQLREPHQCAIFKTILIHPIESHTLPKDTMPIQYQSAGPVDCTVDPSLEKLEDKSVIVTGGTIHFIHLTDKIITL